MHSNSFASSLLSRSGLLLLTTLLGANPSLAQIAYPYQAFTSVTPNAFSIYNSGGTAILGYSSTNSSYGIVGYAAGSNGFGVYGNSSDATSGVGVYGYSPYIGVSGVGNTYGVFGVSSSATNPAVLGFNSNTAASTTSYGVVGTTSSNSFGVYGNSTAANGGGVLGIASGSSYGVYGQAVGTTGVGGYGVFGRSLFANSGGIAVYGNNAAPTGAAIVGLNTAPSGLAGKFTGNVTITGNLSITGILSKGSGSFKIDHPLDPANKYLSHSFVESPDMMNIYNGIIALDKNGEATVDLPKWFQALNRDFRYQLTCIGGFAQVFIADEVKDSHFRISGGKPGMKISWQVTGIRQDAFANHDRIAVEENKKPEERGYYLNPEAYGLSPAKGIASLTQPKEVDLAGVPEVKVPLALQAPVLPMMPSQPGH